MQNIRNGEWQPGQKLPSENQWVEKLSVSRMTVNRALRELSQDGIIARVHGVGSFVAEKPRHASLIALQDIAEEIRHTGADYSAKHLLRKKIRPGRAVQQNMLLAPEAEVFHIQSIHYQDQLPLQFESRFVNPEVVPGFLDFDLDKNTSSGYLMHLFQPDEMEHVVRAINPVRKIQKHLEIDDGEPCLELQRRTWKNSKIVTLVTMTYPGSRHELGARYATEDFLFR